MTHVRSSRLVWTLPGPIAGVLVCGGLVGLAPGEEPAAEPAAATVSGLTPVEIETPYLQQYTLTKRRVVADSPAVVAATIAGEELHFVDVDGNGHFGDIGVDGWTFVGDAYRYIVPLEREIIVRGRVVRQRFSKHEAEVSWTADELPTPPRPEAAPGGRAAAADAKVFPIAARRWNDLRIRNGLLPARLDLELSRGCQLHALYMNKNGMTHHQEEGRPGYTPEGAEAGRFSGLGPQSADVEVETAYRTLFHRIQLIHPETRTIGIGSIGSKSVLDGSRGRVFKRRGGGRFGRPVIIPAPGTRGHPRTIAHEEPIPHATSAKGPRGRGAGGCPITLTFLTDAITDVKAELRERGAKGKPVDILVSWPARPAAPSIEDNYKTIGIIARKALRSRTEYWVSVEWTYEGVAEKREFSFWTAK